jgi:hypothetical protein
MYLSGIENVPGAPGNMAMIASPYPGRLPLQGLTQRARPTAAFNAATMGVGQAMMGVGSSNIPPYGVIPGQVPPFDGIVN